MKGQEPLGLLPTSMSLERSPRSRDIMLLCSAGFMFQSDIWTCAPERRHLCRCSSARLAKTLPRPRRCKYFTHLSIMDKEGWSSEAEEADGRTMCHGSWERCSV